MSRITSNVSVLATAAAAVMAIAPLVNAAAINYGTGFETFEGYAVPTPIPAVGTYNGWYRLDGVAVTSGSPNVFIDVPGHLSAQSLHMRNNPPVDQLDPGSVTYAISPVATLPGAGNVVTNLTPFVHIQWDMQVFDTNNIDTCSDTWCLDVYDSTGNNRTASVARSAIAAALHQPPTGANLYTTDGTLAPDSNGNSPYNPASVGAGPASAAWATYEMDLNYITRMWTLKVNGVPTGPARLMNPGADNGIDINFTVNGRGLDDAYFDNFIVTAVPEPSSLAVVTLGVAALAARRRRN